LLAHHTCPHPIAPDAGPPRRSHFQPQSRNRVPWARLMPPVAARASPCRIRCWSDVDPADNKNPPRGGSRTDSHRVFQREESLAIAGGFGGLHPHRRRTLTGGRRVVNAPPPRPAASARGEDG